MRMPILATWAAALLATATLPAWGQTMSQDGMMGGMETADVPQIPAVAGYVDGEGIFFLHTETSDPEIAQILTDMMASPVPVVPSLADIPQSLLATVYVFANGVVPEGPRGPLGFQPDVFDRPPDTPDYTPLRRVVLVTWSDAAMPRLLRSAGEVTAAVEAGDVTLEEPGVVVNMPFVTWPGGQR